MDCEFKVEIARLGTYEVNLGSKPSLCKNPGIYGIFHGDKVYVGQTKNLKKRFGEHVQALRKGRHSNYFLQSSYLKYGEEKHIFKVLLETPDLEDLDYFEELFMAISLKNGISLMNFSVLSEDKKNLIFAPDDYLKSTSPNRSTKWFHNPEDGKSLMIGDLEKVPEGFLPGRSSEEISWWTNGIENLMVTSCPGEGWYKGRAPLKKRGVEISGACKRCGKPFKKYLRPGLVSGFKGFCSQKCSVSN